MDSLRSKFVNSIDAVVYINLLKRKDRDERMKRVVSMFGNKVQRFEAIEHENGSIGCTRSHIAILKMAMDSDWKNILILEDDVDLNETIEGYEVLDNLMSKPYDVILLGGAYTSIHRDNYKLLFSCGTFSYLINRSYFSTLYSNFISGLELLEHTHNHLYYSVDRYWGSLMEADNWYCVAPNIFYHTDDYSNISHNVRKLDPKEYLKNSVKIKKATWGYGILTADVTDIVNKLPTHLECKLTPELLNNIDPYPNNRKVLIVEKIDGSFQIEFENNKLFLC
jgi:glycosyl transferase family 25